MHAPLQDGDVALRNRSVRDVADFDGEILVLSNDNRRSRAPIPACNWLVGGNQKLSCGHLLIDLFKSEANGTDAVPEAANAASCAWHQLSLAESSIVRWCSIASLFSQAIGSITCLSIESS